eukprot:TRINITY_DN12565_c0_g1_i1.p2 TRINITY_DN12565_c0_g1~~TRINITY_DN12565_c0_g1_i1.p2  ORF type:complete len:295 (+),score=121.85 TRINITY_DN12565_c0_g1_i1:58-942(+)
MALPDLSKVPTTEAPPPCILAGQPEEQATNMARGFVQSVYGAMDGGQHAQIPFRGESVACFQKGASDRFKGPSLLGRLQQMHKGSDRDLSGLSVQIFPGNSMFVVVNGTMNTQASTVKSQQMQMQIPFRFADMFLLCSDQSGQFVRAAVFREIDEDCGPAPQGAASGPEFQQADQMAQQVVTQFYQFLDNPDQRQNLTQLFREQSCLTVGQDLFKGSQHIAHKVHYLPKVSKRELQGMDVIPSPANGMFVYVYGTMTLMGEERPSTFIDVFHLMPEGGSCWVTNMFMKVHGGVM